MHVFLSYASEDRPRAEEIALALRGDGHDVFLDTTALAGGDNYNRVIRERLADAELFVFLVSPASVRAGAYTLTELRFAEERWPAPAGRVLPVVVAPTPIGDVPAWLRAVTLLEPRGYAAAEVAAQVAKLTARRRVRRLAGAAALALAVAAAAGLAWRAFAPEPGRAPPVAAFQQRIAEADFVAVAVLPPRLIERTEYALDPTSRFPPDRGDVVGLERIAFGRLADGSKGFSVRVALRNVTDAPIVLDLTPRFFELVDDQGRRGELLYFCCESRGDTLGPGAERQLLLIWRSAPGWEGKETTPGRIHFRIQGLLPLVRGAWSFRPLVAAA